MPGLREIEIEDFGPELGAHGDHFEQIALTYEEAELLAAICDHAGATTAAHFIRHTAEQTRMFNAPSFALMLPSKSRIAVQRAFQAHKADVTDCIAHAQLLVRRKG